MLYRIVSRCFVSACSALALASLLGCESSRLVTKTVTVEVPVPVVKPLPAEITADCPPRYLYPADDLTVEAALDRLEAVEIALAMCRNSLELVRAAQAK